MCCFPHALAAAGVIQPPYEGPKELDTSCKELSEICQGYKKQRNPYDCVDYGKCPSGYGGWVKMTVT